MFIALEGLSQQLLSKFALPLFQTQLLIHWLRLSYFYIILYAETAEKYVILYVHLQ